VLVRAGDQLAEHALYMVAVEIAAHRQVDLIYADEDHLGPEKELQDSHFKTDWNPELLRAWNYIGPFAAIRRSVFAAVGGTDIGGSQDLYLRVADGSVPERIRHIPHILCHRQGAVEESMAQTDRWAVQEHLRRAMISAQLLDGKDGRGHRVLYDLPKHEPKVTLIVPTKDRVDLLRVCVDGVRDRNDYANWKLIIVDNGSVEEITRDYLRELEKDPRISVLRDDGPFNFSALNNRAVEHADSEIIGLLNNDIEPIGDSWLSEMVRQVMQPGVGAVGAKLYYPDDTLQHGGVIIGVGGIAGHFDKRLARTSRGYFDRAVVAQDMSAVTAACMLVRREVFEAVGGLDADGLAIAFNDVDLCLKIREAGHRIVWTPYAELYHHESISRGDDTTGERADHFKAEQAVFEARWRHVIAHDPYYNPNLTLERERPELAIPPRVELPWEDFYELPE
jgi:GT2 family glycosyltransferase